MLRLIQNDHTSLGDEKYHYDNKDGGDIVRRAGCDHPTTNRNEHIPLLLPQRNSLQWSSSLTLSSSLLSTLAHTTIRTIVLKFIQIFAVMILIIACVGGYYLVPRIREDVNLQLEYKLAFHSLNSAEIICLSRPRSPLIISLTTLPQRTSSIRRTLLTLLLQTRCPTAIWLWVPLRSHRFADNRYTIPSQLLAFNTTSEIFHIFTSDTDYGPATKFIPAIQRLVSAQEMNQGLVVLDDDILYSPHLLSYYECYRHQHPGSALSNWGCTMNIINAGDFSYDESNSEELQVQRWCFHGFAQSPPDSHIVDVMLGTASYYIQPSFFSQEVLYNQMTQYDLAAILALLPNNFTNRLPTTDVLIRAAFYEDDLWLSLLLTVSHTVRLTIPISPRHYRPFDTLLMTRGALSHADNADEVNFRKLGLVVAQLNLLSDYKAVMTNWTRRWSVEVKEARTQHHNTCDQ